MPEEITLENLAEKIDEGFKKAGEHTDKKIDEKIDDLGRMINRSFNEVYLRFDRIEIKLENIVYKEEFEKLENRIKIIEQALAIPK